MIELLDAVFLIAVSIIALWVRTPNAICVLLPTLFTYVYAYHTASFETHSGVMNHVVYGLMFVSTAYYASIRLAFALLVYVTFHFFYALDYFIYPVDLYNSTLLSNIYRYIANGLNFLVIVAIFEGAYNDNKGYYRNVIVSPFSVDHLWYNQTNLQKNQTL